MPAAGRRALIALLVTATLIVGVVLGVRWLLGPDNLARVITAWIEREWQAELSLREPPGVRLVPRLQLSLRGAELARGDTSIATAEELNVALPWSTLWSGRMQVESLTVRRPVVHWPELAALLADLADPGARRQVPRLPEIQVGVRIEDGQLHSGAEPDAWRLDRISIVTTPLMNGRRFHLDAGALLRGDESRTVSLTLATVPERTDRHLLLDRIQARMVVSPDQQPLEGGMIVELAGQLQLDEDGLARVDLDGHLPGWPDWLPNTLDFDPEQGVQLLIRWLEHDAVLLARLGQGEDSLEARLDGRDLQAAWERIERPLAALAAIRGQWRLNALRLGDLHIEGIQLEVIPPPADPEQPPPPADGD